MTQHKRLALINTLFSALLIIFSTETALANTQDVNAGPIWNNGDAQNKCTRLAQQKGMKWTGQWRTTEPGRMSVCQLAPLANTEDVNAGPIWNNSDAQNKCTRLAQQKGMKWTGQWRTTEPGRMSVCQLTTASSKTTTNSPSECKPTASNICFVGELTISPESREAIQAIADKANAHPATRFVLKGHSRALGDREAEYEIGEKRAKVVYQALNALGVSASQMSLVSYGMARPVTAPPSNTENDRVEVEWGR